MYATENSIPRENYKTIVGHKGNLKFSDTPDKLNARKLNPMSKIVKLDIINTGAVFNKIHLYNKRAKQSYCSAIKEEYTVESVLKDHPIGHKNVVCQARWSLVTGSFVLKCRSFCQSCVVCRDRWSLMAVVPQDRFHCTCEYDIKKTWEALRRIMRRQYMYMYWILHFGDLPKNKTFMTRTLIFFKQRTRWIGNFKTLPIVFI